MNNRGFLCFVKDTSLYLWYDRNILIYWIISMKRFLSSLLLFFLFSTFITNNVYGGQNYFIVTAYYSPLPNQQYYAMWNYQAEVILNGQGIAGASGRKVFSGMLAAPGPYSFGTKIYLEWLGIGSVEDRGGAIVSAWERGFAHDRIDVWMWYGDEWLRRALYWGKRKVAGNIVNRNSATTINYHNIPTPYWTVAGFRNKNYVPPVVKLPTIFETSISEDSNTKLISNLQAVLSELGYLASDYDTGKYDEATKWAVLIFQLETWVVPNSEVYWATIYGPKTRGQLQIRYDEHLAKLAEKEVFLEKHEELHKEALEDAWNYVGTIWAPVLGEVSHQVRELQKLMKKLWHFDHKDTAIFWPKTEISIMEFQIAQKLITNPGDPWSGRFGPKTKETVKKVLADIYLQERIDSEWLREDYDKYIAK